MRNEVKHLYSTFSELKSVHYFNIFILFNTNCTNYLSLKFSIYNYKKLIYNMF